VGGEEALAYYLRQGTGFPWVALRLADVIGQCGGGALTYYLRQGIGFLWVELKVADVIGQWGVGSISSTTSARVPLSPG
jgi:hypothetical protein